jgi:hypothetical protein
MKNVPLSKKVIGLEESILSFNVFLALYHIHQSTNPPIQQSSE